MCGLSQWSVVNCSGCTLNTTHAHKTCTVNVPLVIPCLLCGMKNMIHLRIRPFDHRHRSYTNQLQIHTLFLTVRNMAIWIKANIKYFYEWHSIMPFSLDFIVVNIINEHTVNICDEFPAKAYLLTIYYCANHLIKIPKTIDAKHLKHRKLSIYSGADVHNSHTINKKRSGTQMVCALCIAATYQLKWIHSR